MLGCIFSLIVVREQQLRWWFLLRFVFRKIKGERNGILVELEIWSQSSWSVLEPVNTGAANYEPKLQKKQRFLAALKRWV